MLITIITVINNRNMTSKRKNKEVWAPTGFEEWGGYMAAKKAKLEEQFQEKAAVEFKDASNLFQGICIFVNGYTRPSADELRLLMMKHNGVYHYYMRPRITTHIIASNLPYSKIMTYKNSQNPLPICKPEWITDSINAGKLLNYQDYLLYSNHTKTQPKLAFSIKEMAKKNLFSNEKDYKTKNFIVEESSSSNDSKNSNSFANSNEISEPGTSKDSDKPSKVLESITVCKETSPMKESGSKFSDKTENCISNASDSSNDSNNSTPILNLNEQSEPCGSKDSNKSFETSESMPIPKETSPIKGNESKSSSNSTKNPEFLSEFYNNSRLHHISTMGAVFKDYINELRDKSDKSFPGLERLKKELNKVPKSAGRCSAGFESDSEYEESLDTTPGLNSNTTKQEPVIMHIDMDCFFVSVGLRNKPELRGLPIAVTHAKGNKAPQNANSREIELKMYKERFKEKVNKNNKTVEEKKDPDDEIKDKKGTETSKHYENSSLSEIASCSYEARKAGIKNGMFLGQALKLCPDLKTIQYDFEGYKEVSYTLYDTVATYTLDIEAVSCDEMYADCSKILFESGLRPLEFAEIIRKEITLKTGCPVSTGFGKNKLQARLATRRAKPNGQFYLESKDVERYMSTINIRDLPGVGSTMNYKLNKMGVYTCAELQSVSLNELRKEFGKKTGEMLYNICRGIDNSKLNLEHVRKSVSAEVNYGIRFENSNDADKFLKQLSQEVCNRLNKANVKGRSVTLKLMIRSKNAPIETAKYMGHGLCDHFTKSKNLISCVNSPSIVTKEVLSLWNQLQQKPQDVRGVGIQISRLESIKKGGNSDLLSFIGKGKQANTDNKQITTIEQNIKKDSKPKGALDGFLIAKEFPPITIVKENSAVCETSETVISNNILSCSELATERKEFGTKEAENGQKNSPPSPERSKDDDLSTFRAVRCNQNRAFDGGTTVASTSKEGKRIDQTEDHPLMEDIDESVLAELPEDIRNEIITAAKKSDSGKTAKSDNNDEKKGKDLPNLVQRKQDSYFKESKRNIEKPKKKSEMPSLQEIDIAVLLELPDDIRNEILNEYREKVKESNRTEESRGEIETREERDSNRLGIDEMNLSISQVDPEILAQLPKDIQNDVKNYCASKKKEKIDKKMKSDGTTTGKLLSSNENNKIGKQQTKGKVVGSTKMNNNKIVNKNKSKSKNNNLQLTTGSKNLKKSSPELRNQQIINNDNDKKNPRNNDDDDDDLGNVDREPEILKKSKQNTKENIKSLSTAAKSGDPDDQKILLKLLVEEFMNLPLKEVKLQIQNWISNSDSVNEVDFLSFTTFLSSLPKMKRIEDLHVLIKTMHRCIERTKLCIWHRAYRKTVEHVQRHMLATYDSSLMVPIIECEDMNCKNNKSF